MQFFRFRGGPSLLIDVSQIRCVAVEPCAGMPCARQWIMRFWVENDTGQLTFKYEADAHRAKEELDCAIAHHYAAVVEAVEMKE